MKKEEDGKWWGEGDKGGKKERELQDGGKRVGAGWRG